MKNIVVIPAVKPKDKSLSKFGGWQWMEYSIEAWTYWCKKYDYELVIYDTPYIEDTSTYRVTVQRWFDIFRFLEERGIEYDQILMTDAAHIPHWNCADIFQLSDNKFTVTHEYDNFKWIYESIEGYKHMFDNYDFDLYKYFNAGLVIFNKSHKQLIEKFQHVYTSNIKEFVDLQKTVRRGTDQTPLNYIVQMNNEDINFLPMEYRVSHLPRKELLTHNWQLNDDQIPFFIKYGSIWGFQGFDKAQRNSLMEQTWNLIKKNYE